MNIQPRWPGPAAALALLLFFTLLGAGSAWAAPDMISTQARAGNPMQITGPVEAAGNNPAWFALSDSQGNETQATPQAVQGT
ncbi:MAG: hypothetical protein M1319_06505 [Chloroflexi bacterium]|nr:hypothetical protein [Chloroflexota bacterium]